MPFEMDRQTYSRLYGPTTGDRVRLGDTNLLADVERDDSAYGDEPLWGFGKTIRDAMTLAPTQAEAPFIIAQLAVLVLFAVLGLIALNTFYPDADAEA